MGTPVRIVAANLTSGSNQSYDPGHGIRILQGLAADVILIQEMNYGANGPSDLQSLTTAVCGASCSYVRGPMAQIPNGIISRYPILSSGSWTDPNVDNRNFVYARIDVPGPTELFAISVHLLGSGSTQRNLEAQELVSLIGTNVDDADYLVLGGDFNTSDRGEAAIQTLDGTFVVSGPFPKDQLANDLTNGPRNKPYDWVLGDADLESRAIPVLIGASTFDDGAVIDTRVYTPLSEIAPALMGDSGANGMQHMAVVRDFAFAP